MEPPAGREIVAPVTLMVPPHVPAFKDQRLSSGEYAAAHAVVGFWNVSAFTDTHPAVTSPGMTVGVVATVGSPAGQLYAIPFVCGNASVGGFDPTMFVIARPAVEQMLTPPALATPYLP